MDDGVSKSQILSSPVQVASLAASVNDLFAAFRDANGLTANAQSNQVAEFFKWVNESSDFEELYKRANRFASTGVDNDTLSKVIDQINDYMHLSAVGHEARSQTARRQLTQNMWNEIQEKKDDIVSGKAALSFGYYTPGGWAEWLFPHIDRNGTRREAMIQSPREMIDLVRQITLEKIITQHPTNSNTIELNRVVAEMVGAAIEITTPSKNPLPPLEIARKFTETLKKFASTSRVPDGNFTVTDEINNGHNSVMNIMAGRRESLRELLELTETKFGAAFTPDLQVALARSFHVSLGDWAAGDKDGNSNIKAEHRLAKLVKQRLMMADYYKGQLEELQKAGEESPFIPLRIGELTAMKDSLQSLRDESYKYEKPGGDIVLSAQKFDYFSDSINKIAHKSAGVSYGTFAEEMMQQAEQALRAAPQGKRRLMLLELVNDLENSGMRGAHNELRENSSFNEDVLRVLLDRIPGAPKAAAFTKLSENKQLEILDDLIMNPKPLQEAARQIINEAAPVVEINRSYKDPLIQAYHTLQALKLTQSHRDIYENMVMAETKQAKDLLIATALQGATHSPQQEPHWLRVVPLFEDPNSLRHYSSVILKALNFDSFRQVIAKTGGVVQIMFGHSDGWRLAGRIAADGLLGIANKGPNGIQQIIGMPIRWMGKTVKLVAQEYLGISLSDVSRSGGRDPTGNIGDETAARHPKNLVQGVDSVNHYNDAASASRIITKEITKSAKVLLGNGKSDVDLDLAVCESAAATTERYKTVHFEGTMRRLLAHPLVNLVLTGLISNFSSRGANRQGTTGNAWAQDPTPGDLDGSRAISVSTALFYGNVVNTWFVAEEFEKNLARKIASDQALQNKIAGDGERLFGRNESLFAGDSKLSAFAASTLYKTSSEYRRILDKSTQGVALTNLALGETRRAWGKLRGLSVGDTESDSPNMHTEYCAAARLGYISFLGKEPPNVQSPPSSERSKELRSYIEKDVLPAEDRSYMSRLSVVLFALHDRIIANTAKAKVADPQTDDSTALKLLRKLHNAMNRAISPSLDITDLPVRDFIKESVANGNERPQGIYAGEVKKVLAA